MLMVVLVVAIAVASSACAADLYVSYFYENTVHKFGPSGIDAGVFASTGGPYQRAVAFDSQRNMYVSSYDETIYKFGPGGNLLGRLDTLHLTEPRGLAFDRFDNLYVANNESILKFGPDGSDLGTFATVNPTGRMVGLAFDGIGNLFAAVNLRGIAKFSPSGAYLGMIGEDVNIDNGPNGLAIDSSGNIYTSYYWDNTIHKFGPDGTYLGIFASTGMNHPMGLAFDPIGNLYVANDGVGYEPPAYANSVHKYGPNGQDLGTFVSTGAGTGPEWLAFAPDAVTGDYNGNGAVDAADYTVWRDDSTFTQNDYNVWRANFGQTAANGTVIELSSTGVPEPSSAWLLAVAAVFSLVVAQQRALLRPTLVAN